MLIPSLSYVQPIIELMILLDNEFVKLVKNSKTIKNIPEREDLLKYSTTWNMNTSIKNEKMIIALYICFY